MASRMITFDEGEARFNYRVVGIALHGDRVLLHRAVWEWIWYLPGGRGELLEPARETLKREMREELGVEIEVGRLLWVMENFFELNGKSYHELGLYFLMTFPDGSGLPRKDEFVGDEEGIKLIFKWFPITQLESVRLYPSFLALGLKSIPPGTEHVVHTDVIG